jgi:ABC-type branched-subunit amino acid transport system ATPase component
MLMVSDLTKRFGGLVAVDSASLEVAQGEIVALIGPNGAGKTTLFELISGFQRPDSGEIAFQGASVIGRRPHQLAQAGLVRTFQIVRPFANLSVRDNIAAAAHTRIIARSAALAKAEEVAQALGMGALLDDIAGALPIAGRKRLEIARAVATDPVLLLLDEVMAGLNPTEIAQITPMIRRVRDQGTTILMIEHVMQAVMTLSDRAYVLNNGAIIAAGTPGEIVEDPAVIEAYLGAGMAKRLARTQAGAVHA